MTEPIVARFVFLPDRAGEFLFEEGQLVTEVQVDTIEEVMEYSYQFNDALEDAVVYMHAGINPKTGEPVYKTVSLLESSIEES